MIMLRIKPGMAIHCKTREEANLLFDNTSLKFDNLFSDKWHHWDIFGENTCYSFNQYEVWSYGHYDYYKEDPNYEVIEFKDLFVTEESLPSVLETIEKLSDKIFKDDGEKNKPMLKTGILLKCERCDKEKFFEDKDARGDAENSVLNSNWETIENKWVCPDCVATYKALTKTFWERVVSVR